jgi:hypothetical protein
MDISLPRWQRVLWTGAWAFSAGFTVATLLFDRVIGRKP